MSNIKSYHIANKAHGEHPSKEGFFDANINIPLMHQAVVRQLANARRGSASTLTRSEVRGGGKKPWKQKGTGRARAGSIRSPLWKGGGISFGPKPRSYVTDMPKMQRKLAFRSALAAKKENFVLLMGHTDLAAKTKQMVEVLAQLNMQDQKVLLLVSGDMDHLILAGRNLPNVTMVHAQYVGPYELLRNEYILMTEDGLATLEERSALHAS